MQLDHDVADSLRLAQRYTDVMSRRDLVRFHALRGGFLARRMLRAALRRRGRRLVAAARMFGRSGQSLVHCLALAGRPAAADASLSDSSVT
jgi:hypothetical protein